MILQCCFRVKLCGMFWMATKTDIGFGRKAFTSDPAKNLASGSNEQWKLYGQNTERRRASTNTQDVEEALVTRIVKSDSSINYSRISNYANKSTIKRGMLIMFITMFNLYYLLMVLSFHGVQHLLWKNHHDHCSLP